METRYVQELNLDLLDVFLDLDKNNTMFFKTSGIENENIGYGKHVFKISYTNPDDSPYQLKEFTNVLFEVKDYDGNVILSGITDVEHISGASVCYLQILENPLESQYDIADGPATLTIVGELSGVPCEWENKYNVRCVVDFHIFKENPNNSEIIFKEKPTLKIGEKVDVIVSPVEDSLIGPILNPFYQQAVIEFDNLNTWGGDVRYAQVYHRFSSSKEFSKNYQAADLIDFHEESPELLTTNITKSFDYTSLTNPVNAGAFGPLYTSDLGSENGWFTPSGALFTINDNIFDETTQPLTGSGLNLHQTYYSFGVHNVVRKTVEDETFELKLNVSGSGEYAIISANQSEYERGFLTSNKSLVYDNDAHDHWAVHLTHSFDESVPFRRSGDGTTVGTLKFAEQAGPLVDGDYDTDISGSYRLHTFTVPKDRVFALRLAQHGTATNQTASFADISIKQKYQKGINPVTYYKKVKIPYFESSREIIDHKVTFLNSNFEVAKQYDVQPIQNLELTSSKLYRSYNNSLYRERGPHGLRVRYAVSKSEGGGSGKQAIIGEVRSEYDDTVGFLSSTGFHGGSFLSYWTSQSGASDSGVNTLMSPLNAVSKVSYDVRHQSRSLYGATISGDEGVSDVMMSGKLIVNKYEIGYHPEQSLYVDGNAYFSGGLEIGSGDLNINGDITANQYIVSSSTTYITTSYSAGSTEFGDSSDDTHTFTGNITASGDISASGEIRGATLKVGDKQLFVEANSRIDQDLTTDATAEFAGLVLTGADAITFVGGTDYTIGADNPIDFDLKDNNSSALSFDASGKAGMLEFDTTNGSEIVNVSSDFIVAGTMSGSGNLIVGGNVTVNDTLTSNDITASNSILLPHEKTITFANSGNSIASSGELSAKSLTITSEQNINLTTANNKKVLISNDLKVSNNITASGDISSSGHLIASTSNAAGSPFLTVLVDTGSGQFYYTGSYGGGSSGGSGGGGSGTVTSIVAGSGLYGGTITSTGTLSVDSASMGGFYSASMNDFTTPTASIGTTVQANIGTVNDTSASLTVDGHVSMSGHLYNAGDIILTTNSKIFKDAEERIEFGSGITSFNTSGDNVDFQIHSEGQVLFHADAENDGVVIGGGTVVPSGIELTVVGDISASRMYLKNDGNAQVYASGDNGTNGKLQLLADGSGGTSGLIISGAANSITMNHSGTKLALGKTTLPTSILDVDGDLIATTGSFGTTVQANIFNPALSDTSASLTVEGNVSASGKLFVGSTLDVDGTTNLDAVDIDGNVDLDGNLTSGQNGSGYQFKLFGDGSNQYMVWDNDGGTNNGGFLKFSDNAEIGFGENAVHDAHDAVIVHDGSNTKFSQTGTGDLFLIPQGTNDKLVVSGSGNTLLEVEGNVTANSGSFGDIDLSGDITATGDVNFGGTMSATGNISSSGEIFATGDIESDGTIIGDGLNINGTTTFNDGDITHVGDINCDSISVDHGGVGLNIDFGGNTTLNKISLTDNLADALNITEGSNSYIKFTTTDDGEKILFSEKVEVTKAITATTGSFGTTVQANIGTINDTSASLTVDGHVSMSGDLYGSGTDAADLIVSGTLGLEHKNSTPSTITSRLYNSGSVSASVDTPTLHFNNSEVGYAISTFFRVQSQVNTDRGYFAPYYFGIADYSWNYRYYIDSYADEDQITIYRDIYNGQGSALRTMGYSSGYTIPNTGVLKRIVGSTMNYTNDAAYNLNIYHTTPDYSSANTTANRVAQFVSDTGGDANTSEQILIDNINKPVTMGDVIHPVVRKTEAGSSTYQYIVFNISMFITTS